MSSVFDRQYSEMKTNQNRVNELVKSGDLSINEARMLLGQVPIEKTQEYLEKMGNRFNKEDAAQVQKMHDMCAGMCDKAHCDGNNRPGGSPGENEAGMLGDVGKRGSRHSGSDMMQMKSIHDCCKALGAKCM